MKPGLLPMMLLRRNYATVAFLDPNFPVGKTMTKIGPNSKTIAKVGPSSVAMEVPR